MKSKGLALDYYLVDGSLDGRIHLSSPILPVEATKVPVEMIDGSTKMENLRNPGVYILIGEGKLYVGQASERENNTSFISRWKEHKKKKPWVREAIAFYSSSKAGFTATDLNWLEREMVESLKEAKGYTLENGATPSVDKNLPDAKIMTLSTILNGIKTLTEIFGYRFFRERGSHGFDGSEYTFRGAYMVSAGGKYILKAHSKLSPIANEKYQYLRDRPEIKGLNVIDDIVLDAPSTAAQIVAGSSINGWRVWKRDGKTIDEVERNS